MAYLDKKNQWATFYSYQKCIERVESYSVVLWLIDWPSHWVARWKHTSNCNLLIWNLYHWNRVETLRSPTIAHCCYYKLHCQLPTCQQRPHFLSLFFKRHQLAVQNPRELIYNQAKGWSTLFSRSDRPTWQRWLITPLNYSETSLVWLRS